VSLYDGCDFQRRAIELRCIKANPLTYRQFDNEVGPSLSIVDVLMFNQPDAIREYLGSGFELIQA